MNTKTLVASLKNHKGQHLNACWKRQLKTRADVASIVEKRVCCYVRAGINYANLSAVRDGIATGEREAVEKLPWGEWAEFPFTLTHKGADYIRLYPSSFPNLQRKEVTYFIDGAESTVEKAKELCLASEFRDREEAPLCFTIKTENIVYLGGPETTRHADGSTSSDV